MPPLALPNLYATPVDVWDYCGVEGVELSLDDHLNATGQKIMATVDALQGAAVVNITALACPLLRGTVLTFDGAGMPNEGQLTLATTATRGSMTLNVVPLVQQINAQAAANDSGVNLAQAQRLVKSCAYGTDEVKMYCCSRYNDSDLVKSFTVNRWATICAAKWLLKRRSRPCPQGVMDDYNDALKVMEKVQSGKMQISGLGTRTAGWPYIDNFVIDQRYEVTKIRVEPALSEATPTQFAQFLDWNSVFLLEF